MIDAKLDKRLMDAAFTLMMAAAPHKRDEIRDMLCMVVLHIHESWDASPRLTVIEGGKQNA